ncbi:MAG TPA: chemotaxis response regulator protein-glutamate methylesterase [Caulobacteraceae bacterium]|jgi:two-component system chemotaxis response regulator CheB|nr:chemotaxis response regulator protein-glutamate methylesterase [Caulobacteraceae bacterium]
MNPIRVLVVDDSATMRGLITACLRQDPQIEVVGSAGDPIEARGAIKALNPDVITLDVEMPNMSGVEFLDKIMRLRPTPVVMVSTLTQRGTDITLQALELGAVDCVGKPGVGQPPDVFARELVEKVRTAARARLRSRDTTAPPVRRDFRGNGSLLAIGSSTGGVEALLTLLGAFPANCPATVITQHMPASFTRSFAERLNRTCQPQVQEAYEGAPLTPGQVYIAPGGATHLKVGGRSMLSCHLAASDLVNGHRPSVDVLFDSVAMTAGAASVGVILTGMGRDGAAGLLAMRQAGATTFGQDEATCVVYGMPKAALERGAVGREAPITQLASLVLDACETRSRVH